MQKTVDLKNYDIVVVATAVVYNAEEMAKWVRAKCKDLALITISSHYAKDVPSCCEYYKENVLKKRFRLAAYHHSISFIDSAFFLWLNLSIHFFSICYAFFRLRKKFDVYLAFSYFDTLVGLLLRNLGICHRVIYYCGDYFREYERWNWGKWYSSLRTNLFQLMDRMDVRFCDAVWNDTFSMLSLRKEKRIFVPPQTPYLVAPVGLTVQEEFLKNKQYNSNEIVFIGNLQRYQGLDLFLDILPELIKEIPNIKLHVIGRGSYENELKNLVYSQKLESYVKFYGFVKSQQMLNEIFTRSVLGLAPYVPSEQSFIQYVNPGKVREYLSYGLPVIMTNVSELAKKVSEVKAGFVINYSKSELKEVILKLLKNRDLLNLYGHNAKGLAFEFSWDRCLNRAFYETFKGWGIES